MEQSVYTQEALNKAFTLALNNHHEFITPEHILLTIMDQEPFKMALTLNFYDEDFMRAELKKYIDALEVVPENVENHLPEASYQLQRVLEYACIQMERSNAEELEVTHIIMGILALKDSKAEFILLKAINNDKEEFMSELINQYEFNLEDEEDEDEDYDEEEEEGYDEMPSRKTEPWNHFVTCLNDHLAEHNPLIGREQELERTIQVLCRREKNNPLHIGEPGVGKTALAYGLANMIEKGEVPERLKGYKIYELDLGAMVAGSQYRGDFEKRIKMIMEGLKKEGKVIVYIDEIHNLIGAGRTNDSSMDAGNLLKPYLSSGDIKFIGSTTYQEYNRYFSQSKGIVRRFQQINIPEPSIEESIHILQGLQANFEKYHGIHYLDGVIPYAVEQSARFINERFLPDKAIDLIDEAGAFRELHPTEDMTVSKEVIAELLSKICRVDAKALKENDNSELETLEPHILSQIYGQDEAIKQVVEAVQMSKAGLLDAQKPIASLLFVGPTGVGKTEVAKVLAKELGISLVRFDMSEYTEKHTVAKLIGSPAGYVGYEDGGLLTDAIRKTPNCILLLDEIEKAHSDIFNLLLQVMDYANLTDNRGQKADFRQVILIMTSNAGAQYANQALGFNAKISKGTAMLKDVKRIFKPEFINRLSGIVTFHDMDEHMANLILDKKLRELQIKLDAKNVQLTLTPAARQHLLQKGSSQEYGAREMDRVIQQLLNPLLMREILFGKLKDGGELQVDLRNDSLTAI